MNLERKHVLMLAVVLNTIPLLSDTFNYSFDAYTHMFFASHYLETPLSYWDPRWFCGFNVMLYPPLAHELLAAVATVMGLENSYRILCFIFMMLFVMVSYQFSLKFRDERASVRSMLSASLLPSLWTTVYSFGQFTTLVSLVFGIAGFVFLVDYLEKGGAVRGIVSFCLLASAIASHNLSAMFFIPGIFLLALIKSPNFKRGAIVGLLLLVVFAMIMYPLAEFSLLHGEQREIPHMTRENYLEDPYALVVFFLNYYGLFLLAIPLAIAHLIKRRERAYVGLVLISLFYLVMGLGGTTPLPAMLLGKWSRWIIYDRFSLWASVMLIPVFGEFVDLVLRKDLIFFVFLFLAVAHLSADLNVPSSFNLMRSKIDMSPLISFLREGNRSMWRYITLGFGEAQLAKFSIYSGGYTVDGTYYTARTLPILRESGVGAIDSAKYYPNGTRLLELILSRAKTYKLRWIFCADPFYFKILASHGFKMVMSEINAGVRMSGVTIWEFEGKVPPLNSSEISPKSSDLYFILWAYTPPLILLVGIGGMIFEFASEHRRRVQKTR